jgi:hypothetical protein
MSGLAVTRAVAIRRLVCTATRRAWTRSMATDETSVGVPEGAAEWRVRALRKELRRRLANHCLSLALCAAVWNVHRAFCDVESRNKTDVFTFDTRMRLQIHIIGDSTFRRNVPKVVLFH